jgi:hypothetical protein
MLSSRRKHNEEATAAAPANSGLLRGPARASASTTPLRTGAYTLSDVAHNRFKSILERDFGTPLPWSDEEIQIMAHNLIHAIAVLLGSRSE